GNYESGRRIGKVKREIISNGTVKDKVTQMKNGAIPVKSINKGVESNKQKDNRAGVKRNEYEIVWGLCDKVVKNEPVVVMEASLDEVTKMDEMMIGLLKTLMRDRMNSGKDLRETSSDGRAKIYSKFERKIEQIGKSTSEGGEDYKDRDVAQIGKAVIDKKRIDGSNGMNVRNSSASSDEMRQKSNEKIRNPPELNNDISMKVQSNNGLS
ncbi:17942_t:CDS:2, partial [Gigaspora rosea]